jgi:hypothetical protein
MWKSMISYYLHPLSRAIYCYYSRFQVEISSTFDSFHYNIGLRETPIKTKLISEDPKLREKKGVFIFPHSPDCPGPFSQDWRFLQSPTSGARVEGFWRFWGVPGSLDGPMSNTINTLGLPTSGGSSEFSMLYGVQVLNILRIYVVLHTEYNTYRIWTLYICVIA